MKSEPTSSKQELVSLLVSRGIQSDFKQNAPIRIRAKGSTQLATVILAVSMVPGVPFQLDISVISNLRPEMIDQLAQLPHLCDLSISNINIHETELQRFAGHQSLRSLSVSTSSPIGDQSDGLARLTQLERLCLDETGINDDGLIKLSPLVRLVGFSCVGCPVRTGLVVLDEFKNLAEVELSKTMADGETVALLTRLHTLKRLSLRSVPIPPNGLIPLASLPQLELLSISHFNLSLEDVEAIANIKTLGDLSFVACQFGTSFLDRLNQCNQLRELTLFGSPHDKAELFSLRTALPDCRINVEDPTQLENPGYAELVEFLEEDDEELTIDSQGFARDVGVSDRRSDDLGSRFGSVWGIREIQLDMATDVAFLGLKDSPTITSVTARSWGEPPRFTSDGLSVLKTLPRLQRLHLTLPDDNGRSLAEISACLGLRELVISDGGSIESSSDLLAQLNELELLSVSVQWQNNYRVLEKLPRLRSLQLTDTAISNNQLRVIERLDHLNELGLSGINVECIDWDAICNGANLQRCTFHRLSGASIPFQRICQLPKIQRLHIVSCALNLEGLSESPLFDELEELTIEECGLTLDEENRILDASMGRCPRIEFSQKVENRTRIHSQFLGERELEYNPTDADESDSHPSGDGLLKSLLDEFKSAFKNVFGD